MGDEVRSGSLLLGWKPLKASTQVCDGDVEARFCDNGMWEGVWNRFDELPDRFRDCTSQCEAPSPGTLEDGNATSSGTRVCIPRRCFERCFGVATKRRAACAGACVMAGGYFAGQLGSGWGLADRFAPAGHWRQREDASLSNFPWRETFSFGGRRRRSYSSPSYGGWRRRRSYSSPSYGGGRRRRWYGRRLLSDDEDNHLDNQRLDDELFEGTHLLESCSVQSFKRLLAQPAP